VDSIGFSRESSRDFSHGISTRTYQSYILHLYNNSVPFTPLEPPP